MTGAELYQWFAKEYGWGYEVVWNLTFEQVAMYREAAA